MVGLLAAAVVLASILRAPGTIGLLGAGLGVAMLSIAVFDQRNFLIPDRLNAVGFVLALIHAVALEPDAPGWAIAMAVMRAGVLGLVFLIVRVAYARIRDQQGLGLGDVKLAAVAGAWLDWPMMPIAMELAALTALSTYLFHQRLSGRALSGMHRLPFGVFFAPAIWLCWMVEISLRLPLEDFAR
jgi:leader peptidase (prepilin peptidase)/N-methyltransferase